MGCENSRNINDSICGKALLSTTYTNVEPLCIEYIEEEKLFYLRRWENKHNSLPNEKSYRIRVDNITLKFKDILFHMDEKRGHYLTLTCFLLSNPSIDYIYTPDENFCWKLGKIQDHADKNIDYKNLVYQVLPYDFFTPRFPIYDDYNEACKLKLDPIAKYLLREYSDKSKYLLREYSDKSKYLRSKT
jgi:hypothetical protein